MNNPSKNNVNTWSEFKKELLSNPVVKNEYDALEDEFALIEALISARVSKKMTQKELAEKVGMKQTAIARLEGGESNPTYLTLSKIAKVLGKKVALI
jgi:DNA-binding XRE family transcriptional regulator